MNDDCAETLYRQYSRVSNDMFRVQSELRALEAGCAEYRRRYEELEEELRNVERQAWEAWNADRNSPWANDALARICERLIIKL